MTEADDYLVELATDLGAAVGFDETGDSIIFISFDHDQLVEFTRRVRLGYIKLVEVKREPFVVDPS
jgi:hypothetical protein